MLNKKPFKKILIYLYVYMLKNMSGKLVAKIIEVISEGKVHEWFLVSFFNFVYLKFFFFFNNMQLFMHQNSTKGISTLLGMHTYL